MRNLNAAYKTFKNSSVKKQCYKNAFFMFCFPETCKLEMFFKKQDFYIWVKVKNTWQPLITQTGRAMKKIVLKREVRQKLGDFT